MSNKYYIDITVPINRNDMISEIRSLKKQIPVVVNQQKYEKPETPITPPKKKHITQIIKEDIFIPEEKLVEEYDTIVNEEITPPSIYPQESVEPQILFSSFGKKKNKKKKQAVLNASMMTSGSIIDFSDDNEQINTIPEDDISHFIDTDAIFRRIDDLENNNDSIIDEQRRGYDKLKKQDNPYKKEFAEELTLLYTLLHEVNKFSEDLERKYRNMEDAKVRGISKYITDLAQAVLASKQSKLSVLREISNVKKIIADLKIKIDVKAKESEGGNSTDRIASAYLAKIFNHGRGNFVRDYGNINTEDDDEGVDPNAILSRLPDEPEIDGARYERLLTERLNNLDSPFRSNAGNKYIEYEHLGVKINIKKCVDTGEWEFIALDKNSEQVPDYPLPTKKDVGKVKFSADSNYATDAAGRTYRVVEYYSPTEDY